MNVREKMDRWRADAEGLEIRPAPVGVVQTCISQRPKVELSKIAFDGLEAKLPAAPPSAAPLKLRFPIVRRDDCIGESVYDEKLAVLLGNNLLNLKCGDGRLEVRANPRAEPREP